jgi:hypothetical protein
MHDHASAQAANFDLESLRSGPAHDGPYISCARTVAAHDPPLRTLLGLGARYTREQPLGVMAQRNRHRHLHLGGYQAEALGRGAMILRRNSTGPICGRDTQEQERSGRERGDRCWVT